MVLRGTVPGVFINQNSGQTGRNSVNIRIRGVSTPNNASLVLVDGIEAPMDNINTEDTVSITVLKDAASAATYGSRAANGVVLITSVNSKTLSNDHSSGRKLELGDWLRRRSTLDKKVNPITLEEGERAHILWILETTRWKVSGKNRAAAILDLIHTILESKMKTLRMSFI